MDQTLVSPRDETGASRTSASARRRSRPLTRLQEVAVLGIAFGFGAILQAAYLLQGTVTP